MYSAGARASLILHLRKLPNIYQRLARQTMRSRAEFPITTYSWATPQTLRFAPTTLCFATPTFVRFSGCLALKWWCLTLAMQTCHISRHFGIQALVFILKLTRAPLGYFFITRPTGGGAISSPPPLISETTGPILKIQAAFESPGKTVEGKQILLTSGSRVTSQVRSKSKCSTFRAW